MMHEIPYEEGFYICCCVIISAYPGRKFMIEPIIQTVNPRKLTDASRLVTVSCRGCCCINDHVKHYYAHALYAWRRRPVNQKSYQT